MKVWKNLFGTDAADQRRIKSRQKAPVVKEGALDKLKGLIGVGKVWTRQHFILQCDALYYCPNKDFSHTSKKVCMVDVVIDFAENGTKRQYSFAIYDKAMRSCLCVMAAENEQTMHDWIAALNHVRVSLQPVDLVKSVKSNSGHSPPNTLCGQEAVCCKFPTVDLGQAARTGADALSKRHLTVTMDGSDSRIPNQMSSKSQILAPELTRIWNSVVSTSTFGEAQCSRLTEESGLEKRGEFFMDVVPRHNLRIVSVLESDADDCTESVKALVLMGFDRRDGAAALIDCEGRLEDAVILLSRRPTGGNGVK